MIDEYARHNGQADLIRESIDGLVGEDPPDAETEADARPATFPQAGFATSAANQRTVSDMASSTGVTQSPNRARRTRCRRRRTAT